MKAEWICLLLAFANVGFGATAPKPLPGKKPQAELLSLPLSFEANRGQTDRAVKFLSRGDGYALFLTSDSAVFKLRSPGENSSPAVVRMKLAGANTAAKSSGAQALPGTVNYFMGNKPDQWTTGVTTFGKVSFQQIYRGIDLVYYGTQRQLEYDFIVAPGADPDQIALEFSGARPSLGADGDLVLTLDGGPLSFRKPVVYQVNEKGDKDFVAASYKLNGDRVQFTLGQYDPGRTLVVDPVLVYLTYLGGTSADEIGNTTFSASGNPTQGVAVDPEGNVYVTGWTTSTDFPMQGALQSVNTTNAYTGFVTKLNPAGSQLIYSTYFGGSVLHDNSTTRPYAIAVDGSGSAYVTGYTSSPQFPVTAGAYQTICGFQGHGQTNCPNTQSAFLTKLSPTGGSLVYSTYFGQSDEISVAVAVDSKGQAYIAGDSGDQCDNNDAASCFPTTPNAVLPGSAFNHTVSPNNFNQGSAFVAVFDAAGANLLYSSLYGGTGASTGNQHPTFGSGVAVDASGYFYLVGTTESNELPVTPGAFQTTYNGNPTAGFGTSSRGYVAKFKPVSAGASLLYATYFGGFDKTVVSYQDAIAGVAADAAGNAYLSGNASYDFPATKGANNSTPCPAANSCMNRGFLAKLNPSGSALVWATFVGTGVTDPTQSSASTISPPRLDAAGNVYVSGVSGNNAEYPLVNPLQPANSFGGVYVTEYDPTGSTMSFSTVFYDPAANGSVFSSGVDVDSRGNMYVAGYTSQPGLPVTAGVFQSALKGSYDGFIAKISANVIPAVLSAQAASVTASGEAGSIPVTAAAGVNWTANSNASWITVTGGASGSGSGVVSFSVAANTGAARSGTIIIAGQAFTITQQSATSTGYALAGSLAQIASAAGWDTTFTLVNLSAQTANARLNFYENDGTVPLLPFTAPQSPAAGATLAATLDETIDPGGSLLLDTTGPASQPAEVGSAQLLTTGGVDGFAIFSYTPTNQQAVVPLETRNAASYLLPFDNTGALVTGFAIANISANNASVKVVARDDTGAVVPTKVASIPLGANGHNSFMLTDATQGFPELAGKRGTVEFDTPTGGRVSVLGLRVNSGAITTLPVLANVATGGGTFAHVAAGGGWQTTLTLVNTGTASTNVTLNFFDDHGVALTLPLGFPQTGANSSVATFTQALAAGATLIVATETPATAAAVTGSAQLVTSGSVSGSAVFRYDPSGQEAVVPLETRTPTAFVLAFDNTGGLATGLAIANPTANAVSIPVTARDDTGALLTSSSISLAANGHTDFMLTDAQLGYPQTVGKRGTLEFGVPSGGRIATLGIRAQGLVITSAPALAK